MNPNNKFVITINRELGSGGRTVGRKLAEKLGVEFYDKTVINALQEKFHLTVEEIERLKSRDQSWWGKFKHKFSVFDPDFYVQEIGSEPVVLETEEVFRAETEIIKEIAQEESCVIAGRTGFYMFREHPNHLNILIQASMLCRVARMAREQNMSEQEARMTIDKVDQMREKYVNQFTKTSRYDTRNYQLVLTMDEINEDQAVEIILNYIRCMNK